MVEEAVGGMSRVNPSTLGERDGGRANSTAATLVFLKYAGVMDSGMRSLGREWNRLMKTLITSLPHVPIPLLGYTQEALTAFYLVAQNSGLTSSIGSGHHEKATYYCKVATTLAG